VRPVLRLGNPRLRHRAISVPTDDFGSARLEALLTDLHDTMAACDDAGLAAPQIGVPWRVVIYGVDHNPRHPEAPPIAETVLVHPKLTPVDATLVLGWEGCLSVPGSHGQLARWQTARIAWRDPSGEARKAVVDGFEARVAQHECEIWTACSPGSPEHPRAFGFSDTLRSTGCF